MYVCIRFSNIKLNGFESHLEVSLSVKQQEVFLVLLGGWNGKTLKSLNTKRRRLAKKALLENKRSSN